MKRTKRYGNRQGRRVNGDESKRSLPEQIRLCHDTVREGVQLAFYLLLSGMSLGMVLVGAWRMRLWLG